jgi:integrase
MRQGQLLGLQWSDLDLDKGTVTVSRSLAQIKGQCILKEPKSKRSRRTIAPPRIVVSALRDHRQAVLKEGNFAAPVFCTRTGNFIAKSNLIRQVHKPIVHRANERAVEAVKNEGRQPDLLPGIRFHDPRHTHATNLLAQGHSVKAVSQRLGHGSIEITLRVYSHVLPEDDAALAEGLDRMFG